MGVSIIAQPCALITHHSDETFQCHLSPSINEPLQPFMPLTHDPFRPTQCKNLTVCGKLSNVFKAQWEWSTIALHCNPAHLSLTTSCFFSSFRLTQNISLYILKAGSQIILIPLTCIRGEFSFLLKVRFQNFLRVQLCDHKIRPSNHGTSVKACMTGMFINLL